LRDRTKDGIHLLKVWWVGKISDTLTGDPCLTPVCCALLHTSEHHQTLAFPSAVSLWQNQKDRRALIMSRGIPGERLSAHAR